MAQMYSKGYYDALRAAGGDPSKVRYNYGWYAEGHDAEYDDDGSRINFT